MRFFDSRIIECEVSKRRGRDIYHAEVTLIMLTVIILRCVRQSPNYSVTTKEILDDLITNICLAAFWFHLLFAVLLLNYFLQTNTNSPLQTGYWIIKGFVLGSGLIGCVLFPQKLTDIFVQALTVCLVPYLIVQTYFLLFHVLKINYKMVTAFEQSEKVCGMPVAGLLIKASILLGLGLFMTAWAFLTLGNPTQCVLNFTFVVINCILNFIIMVYSITPWRPSQYGLLTSAAMFFYTTCVQLTVVASNPHLQCNTMPNNIKLQIIAIVCGYIILSCLIYKLKCGEDENEYIYEGEQMTYKPFLVHVVYALTFAYSCIQLTTKDLSQFAMWMKQVGLCMSLIIYFCLLFKILKLQRLSMC